MCICSLELNLNWIPIEEVKNEKLLGVKLDKIFDALGGDKSRVTTIAVVLALDTNYFDLPESSIAY
jgi:hypothetical protein